MFYLSQFYNNPNFTLKTIEDRLKLLLEAYSKQAKTLGITIKSYSPETFKKFQSLDKSRQEKIFAQFLEYYKTFAAAIENGIDVEDPFTKK